MADAERVPVPGERLRLTLYASVQFREPITIRVIKVLKWPASDGWRWLDGYELDVAGQATRRRRLFVRLAGLQYLDD